MKLLTVFLVWACGLVIGAALFWWRKRRQKPKNTGIEAALDDYLNRRMCPACRSTGSLINRIEGGRNEYLCQTCGMLVSRPMP
jgi:predicted RNA-binding Zn-ribbon protein involved in translation (DUF1610 family)